MENLAMLNTYKSIKHASAVVQKYQHLITKLLCDMTSTLNVKNAILHELTLPVERHWSSNFHNLATIIY